MPETIEELRVIISAELKPLRDELAKSTKTVKKFADDTKKQTDRIQSMFKALKGAAKVIGAIVAAFRTVKAAIDIASDIEEVENVVNVSFGSMRDMVDDFAKTSIEAFGMSELTAKRTASSYMAMSNGMGYTGRNAAKMSLNVTKLSADMSSFYNVSQEIADTALKSIWTGETETLKRFGVVMNQANLEQYAMRNGMQANIQAMSQQEQLVLRYRYVMEALNLTQGDFARTQDSWANQTRILSERFKQLLGILGAGFIQVLTPVIQVLNTIMSYLIAVAQAVGNVIAKLTGQKAAVDDVAVAAQSAAGTASNGAKSMDKLGKATKAAGQAAKGALASFDDLNVLSSSSAGAGGGAGGGVGAPSAGGGIPAFEIPDYPEVDIASKLNVEGIQEKVEHALSQLGRLKDWIIANKTPILAGVGGLVAGIITFLNAKTILGGLATFGRSLGFIFTNPLSAARGAIAMFQANAAAAFAGISLPAVALAATVALVVGGFIYLWETSETFRDSVIDTWTQIQDLFTTVIGGIGETFSVFWAEYGQPIIEQLTLAWQNFTAILEQLWLNVLKPIIDGAISLLKSLWTNVLQPLLSLALTLIGEVMVIVGKLWNQILSPFIQWFMKTFGPGIKAIIDGIVKFFDGMLQAITPIIDGVKMVIKGISDILKGVIDFVTSVFKGDWDGAWKAVQQVVDGVVKFIGGIFYAIFGSILGVAKGAVDGIMGFFGGLGTWFNNTVIQPIANFFGGLWQGIQDAASNAWDFILGLFNSGGEIFTGIVDGVVGVFRSVVNWLIDGINRVISFPFNVINGLLNDIRGISIMGFQPFGWIPYNALPVPRIPTLAVGTNYVAQDGLAMIHQGEAVVPKKYNPALSGGDQVALLEEQNSLLRQLLAKDTDVYLDGDKIHDSNEKRRKQELDRFGLAY